MSQASDQRVSGASSKALYDRTPPQDIEAERAFLGSILLRPEALSDALDILQGGDTDIFFVPAHQVIFNAILALFNKATPIDPVTLLAEIGVNKAFESVGADSYLIELLNAVPTSANIEYYAQIVLEKSIRRRLIETCALITAESYRSELDMKALLDNSEKQIFALNQERQANRIHALSEVIKSVIGTVEANLASGEHLTGLATGFNGLDKLLSGFQKSEMVILAARPSVGKTALALNIAANAALQNNKCVLIFSLEMAKEQLTNRLLCMTGAVDAHRFRDRYLVEEEFSKLVNAAAALTGAKIFIDETSGLTPMDLRSKARRFHLDTPLDLIIIDYMQLMHTGGRNENRQTEISEISRSIKGLARELSIPILTLSQLSREADKDDRGTPKLSHLRESGAIEQDADVVIILSRPPVDEREGREDLIYATVAKHRNGPTGRADLLFYTSIQRFVDGDTDSGYRRESREDTYSHPVPTDLDNPFMEAAFEEEEEDMF
ncbi:MAG: replicative DNA helicase [Candidatus Hydrogenedens sp.]|jgi:replicative DNA helicase|nr:replicative DNA helicase [Candidatus Hydrogenedens sp.]